MIEKNQEGGVGVMEVTIKLKKQFNDRNKSTGWGGGHGSHNYLLVNKSVLTFSSTDDSPCLNEVIHTYNNNLTNLSLHHCNSNVMFRFRIIFVL